LRGHNPAAAQTIAIENIAVGNDPEVFYFDKAVSGCFSDVSIRG
jgi:hypothetical protein